MLPIRRLILLASLASTTGALPLRAQLTVAERTNSERTSTHAEVLAFIDSLTHHGARMHVGTLGTSAQGRHLPFVVLSRPVVTTPAAAKASGKPILYIQANIHAGEVEGKEAMQELARDLTLGKLKPLLDSVVIIWVPIYNADGNDAFGPEDINRGEQNGPQLVGLRANGQGYDLNRDYVKQEAPETRASLALISKWDPDLFMDLHTTDGSYHGYALTWSPGLNPNHTPTNDWVQDTVLEQIRRTVRERDHFETYPYGNFDGGNAAPNGWRTYESLPRYGTNLEGMTRVSILSEAMSHDPFPRRIAATYAFVLETIRYVAEHRAEMRRHEVLTAKFRPDSVVVRGNSLADSPVRMDSVLVAATRTVTLPRSDSATRAHTVRTPAIKDTVGDCAIAAAGGRGGGRSGRQGRGGGRGAAPGGTTREVEELTGEAHAVYMPVRDRFGAVRKEAMPAAYVLGSEWSNVVALMRRQGIQVLKLNAAWSGRAEHFAIDSIEHRRFFEGHCSVLAEGSWQAATRDTVPAGAFVVPTNQRTGMLAAFLLEPASEDGYLAWNFFDRALATPGVAPVKRWRVMPTIRAVAVP
ncbi:MAG: M14 family metallopeptidase [Gemmatimonadales bacterium]